MTPDQARQVAEHLARAKNALLDALRIAEHSSSSKLACQVGSLAGRVEALQNKAVMKQQQKPLTLRQFARQHGL